MTTKQKTSEKEVCAFKEITVAIVASGISFVVLLLPSFIGKLIIVVSCLIALVFAIRSGIALFIPNMKREKRKAYEIATTLNFLSASFSIFMLGLK